MNNFNKPQILYCQYCNKECKNINSLKQHEIRCKKNPNKINLDYIKGSHKSRTKGYKWLTNGIDQIFTNNFDKYLDLGWTFGMNNQFKQKMSIIKNDIKPLGKCKDPKKELERKQKISNSLKGNKNWIFNKHHGNAKQGWYSNIHCDSTWELAFLVYYKEHNLYIERCNKKFEYTWNNSKHIYIPDFITDEGIIEIKGRKTKQSLEKEKQFPNIKVIDINLIQPYLEYVINKYGKEFWKFLYDK
jgi:hypothetical protein